MLCCAVLCCAPISSSAAVSDWLRVHFRRTGSLERAPRTRWTGGEEAASTSTSAATRRTVREAHGRTSAQVVGGGGGGRQGLTCRDAALATTLAVRLHDHEGRVVMVV